MSARVLPIYARCHPSYTLHLQVTRLRPLPRRRLLPQNRPVCVASTNWARNTRTPTQGQHKG
eukprot:1592498-Pyramimonas_sp.AAC.1